MTPHWRLIEAELVDYARIEGYTLDENPNTGDKFITFNNGDEVYLTPIAKHLAQSFVPKSITVKT